MQVFSADATMFLFYHIFNFLAMKTLKTTPKSSILKQKFRHFRNFHFTAQQPKLYNSCSQMWPIEQLYIELGV